jgi:P-type Mg2+ transporter
MTRIIEIKKDKPEIKSTENNDNLSDYQFYSNLSNEEILKTLSSNLDGLTDENAKKLLSTNGKNIALKETIHGPIYFLFNAFKDHFIIILLFLAVINYSLGDHLGSYIIILIALISALIRFFQDYSVYKFNQKLKAKIYSTCIVLRNKADQEIKLENVVVGDIIKLNAGSIIPADLRLLDAKDLFIDESTFTGESIPVEKKLATNNAKEIFDFNNILLMNSTVVSGRGIGIVIKTGQDTYIGKMGSDLNRPKEITNFDKGMAKITNLLIGYMIGVCLFVLIVNGIIKGNFNEAVLFALSVAVGITPSMLPMIVNVNLTKGSKALADKKTLVKRIESIQNLGAIDILCTDKTGTLTENKITLQKYIDVTGKEAPNILEYAYLNSYYATGLKNLVDRAIITYGKEHDIDQKIAKYDKIDEIPFDYERRKMSIVVKNGNHYRMLTKGALEEILKICKYVKVNNKNINLTKEYIKIAENKAKELAESGMQVIALATKEKYPGADKFDVNYESDMVFVGLVGFLDPPKKDVKNTLIKLSNIGIQTKILTGDNPYATQNICNLVGLNGNNIILGKDMDKLSDQALLHKMKHTDIYARLNPLQKERIIRLYKLSGHVVGFMGDGVNDAPALKQADIGISVNTAASIAKEASDIILLERSLNVIYDGVIEGRKVYGNIIKYMKMALSGDFGDVFSIMIASIFLPFLPLLPIQMLFQDFIYDISQIGIPYDSVDAEFLEKPKKWNTKGISRFMQIMGITSSIVDVLSFLVFWFVLNYNSVAYQAYFQTAWFVTCLITELMIIINVRTSKKPFVESNPSKELASLTIFSMFLTIMTPLIFHIIPTFNFVVLPPVFYLFLVCLVGIYMLLVTIIKKWYIKKYHEWL